MPIDYYCHVCNYKTDRKSNLDSHFTTLNHKKNVIARREAKRAVNTCPLCNLKIGNTDFNVHIVNCCGYEKSKLKNECLETVVDSKEEVVDILKTQLEHVNEESKKDRELIRKMTNLAFLNKYNNDAPVIEERKEFSGKIYEEIIYFYDQLIEYNSKQKLHVLVADLVLEDIKKADPTQQFVWCTDVQRSNCLMHTKKKKKNVWVLDKKGEEMCNKLIDPVINKIKGFITHNGSAESMRKLRRNVIDFIDHSNRRLHDWKHTKKEITQQECDIVNEKYEMGDISLLECKSQINRLWNEHYTRFERSSAIRIAEQIVFFSRITDTIESEDFLSRVRNKIASTIHLTDDIKDKLLDIIEKNQ